MPSELWPPLTWRNAMGRALSDASRSGVPWRVTGHRNFCGPGWVYAAVPSPIAFCRRCAARGNRELLEGPTMGPYACADDEACARRAERRSRRA